jgi:putative membrane protein
VKRVARVAFLFGLGVVLTLVLRTGGQTLLSELSRAGWLLALLVPLHMLPLLLDVLGWRVLIEGPSRFGVLLFIASIREAINRLLPVANIGGEFIGVRLLIRLGTPGSIATASVVVETMLIVVSQSLFALIGLVCLAGLTARLQLMTSLELGLVLGLPALAAMLALIASGSILSQLDRVAARMYAAIAPAAPRIELRALLDGSMRQLVRSPGRLARAGAWQLSGLLAGCVETWLVLRWLGHPVGFAAAVALESLTQAARSLLFIVPAGLGVQELGLIGLSHLLGINVETALALSLAKRFREVLFGLPVLALWQWLEGKRTSFFVQGKAGDEQA